MSVWLRNLPRPTIYDKISHKRWKEFRRRYKRILAQKQRKAGRLAPPAENMRPRDPEKCALWSQFTWSSPDDADTYVPTSVAFNYPFSDRHWKRGGKSDHGD